MRKMKRLLAGVLTAVMLATFLPAGVLAAEGDPPDGSAITTEEAFDDGAAADGEDQAQISLDDLDLYVTVGGEKVYLEEDTMSTFSLIPLENYSYTLNLQGYFPDELKEVGISDLVAALKTKISGFDPDDATVAAWAKWYYYDEDGNYFNASYNDDYTVVGDGDTTIDLSYGARTSQYRSYYNIELIVGTADQLNPDNIRVRIQVGIGNYYDLLDAEVYTTGDPREKIQVYDEYFETGSYYTNYKNLLSISVSPWDWTEGDAYLGLKLGDEYSDLTAKVYKGYYETEDAITEAAAEEITSQIMNQGSLATSGGYKADCSWKSGYTGMPEVTLVLARGGKTVCVMPVILYMYPNELYVYVNDLCYKSGSYSYYSATSSERVLDKAGYDGYWHYTLSSGRKIDETYYASIYAYDPETEKFGADAIKAVYLGYLNSDEIEDAEVLASSSGNSSSYAYYEVDFAEYPNGVTLTVVDLYDKVWHFGIEVEEGKVVETTVPNAPTPLSADTYFRMEDANKVDSGSSYDEYVMSYLDDSYYYYGYQTVFLLDKDAGDSSVKVPVSAEKIVPTFYTGNKVVMQASERDKDGELLSGTTQTSGQTAINFTPGKTVQYSALAENGGNLKNYFVTFLTQQNAPTLFVNGTNDESNWQENPETGVEMPARTVDLTKSWNYQHDIFFANVGKEELTGLKVELTGLDGTGDAENVALDEYWRIGTTDKLAGFTSADKNYRNVTTTNEDGSTTTKNIHDSNGELANVGKIRLVPQRNEDGSIKAGKISGLLTISANGVEPVKILLTGTAGTFQINTDKIRDAVQYVSYSSVIQTNYITSGATNVVRFTASGLPAGITMKDNGELYGAPLRAGDFTFTVTATAFIDGEQKSDTKTFTMHVVSNQNDNDVWYYDQNLLGGTTYLPVIAIPNEGDTTNILGTATEGDNSWDNPTQELKSEGDYALFDKVVRLDGQPLRAGVDYTSAPGSTRVTLQTQTLKNAGNGTHTISVEFREPGTNELRRTAQNYTLKTLGVSTSSNSSSGGGSDSSSTNSVSTGTIRNGSVTLSHKNASDSTRVTITVTPDPGYEVDQVTVTDAKGKQIAVTKVDATHYSFQMPNSKVEVQATFKLYQAPIVYDGPFRDVSVDSWYNEATKYVYEKGLMVGISDGLFGPDVTTNRAMLVTILYSLEGKPEVAQRDVPDVSGEAWYAAPVYWAMENGIVAGYADGRFGADDDLTREQAAIILYGYARLKGYDVSQSNDLSQFADADSISSYALPALQWANAVGLISGYSADTLGPQGSTTRAQMAVILKSFCENILVPQEVSQDVTE